MIIVFDVILICVIIGAIAYSVRLNKQINQKLEILQASKVEMAQCLVKLQDSLERAKVGIGDIKTLGEKIIQDTKENMNKASTVRDEIGFFVDRAEKAIVTLEQRINDAKNVNNKQTPVPKIVKPSPVPKPQLQKKQSVPQPRNTATAVKLEATPKPQPQDTPKVGRDALMELLKGVR